MDDDGMKGGDEPAEKDEREREMMGKRDTGGTGGGETKY